MCGPGHEHFLGIVELSGFLQPELRATALCGLLAACLSEFSFVTVPSFPHFYHIGLLSALQAQTSSS